MLKLPQATNWYEKSLQDGASPRQYLAHLANKKAVRHSKPFVKHVAQVHEPLRHLKQLQLLHLHSLGQAKP